MTKRLLLLASFLGLLFQGLLARSEPIPSPLEFTKGERIALVGNSLGERMSLFGHFESILHSRFPDKELVLRNFSRSADEVGLRQRPNDYTRLDDPMKVFGPQTLFCFFGFNESFGGPQNLAKFKADYERFIKETTATYGKEGKLRFVLISPAAFEASGDRLRPSGVTENKNIELYTAAVAEVAKKLNLTFVDLYTPTARVFAKKTGEQFTIDGVHLNLAGDRLVAESLHEGLFGAASKVKTDSKAFARLRAAVVDKAWVHQQDYRMLNGWYVYGGRRSPYDTETFPEEFKKIRAMVAVRDRYVWDIAQGKPVPAVPDDSGTPKLSPVKTAFGTKSYAEPKELRYLSGSEALKEMTVADGFAVNLFASEEDFPELAKPVQINFDNKGRLWVATMPTYPQWKPGDPRPNDRLLILEDTNNDGKADKVTVFYDQLHCPTGFEFWNGGVIVVSQPRLMFLKDTNGDDKADLVETWIDGWATEDSHHTINAFEWTPGGKLCLLEGVSMSTAVETPWGPFRNKNSAGNYFLDPHTLTLRRYVTPAYGNPWCYVFNFWGQGVVGDGTMATHHWDVPLSTAQVGPRQGLNPIFDNEGMRPAVGSEFLYSRHFPDEVQGQYIYGCVINMNGFPRFDFKDSGSGFTGKRVANLLISNDRNFRPADPQLAPDGSLYFADWHNSLIGHMQYSQRDPNRDHTRGRIYRITAKGRPLLKPVTQFGKSIPELLDQLKEYEPRTRYRARRELRDRPTDKVVAAVKTWVSKLDARDKNYDLYRTEALWVLEGHHAVDVAFLQQMLRTATPEARAAATHVLAEEWQYIPTAMELIRPQVTDEHPRVRLEATRALSFVPTMDSVQLVLQAASKPMDYYLDYTMQHTLAALESIWKPAFQKGELSQAHPEALEYLKAIALGRPELVAVQKNLRSLVQHAGELKAEERLTNIKAVAGVRGKSEGGRPVFERTCVACHKIGDKGADFGPDLSQLGSRMKREDIVESILFPNEKIDPKWLAVNITTKAGDEFSGVVTAEDDINVTLKIGAGQTEVIKKTDISKRQALKVSSMPEGLGETMAPAEFMDLVEYLSTRK